MSDDWKEAVASLDALNAAGTPELLSREEKLVWILGDLMNAAENYFGAKNPKRLGHINSAAIRIIDEVLAPAAARIEALEAALREIVEECSYQSVPIKTPRSTEDIFLIARAALDKDAGIGCGKSVIEPWNEP
jgi:phosphatidylserine/phosphatidylglycerophosphate/cardiolipin synthase-like enzyme